MSGTQGAPSNPSSHGANVPRGLGEPVDPPRGRFGRMFTGGHKQLSDGAINELLMVMSGVGHTGESKIPAGFTYLGQFVDHDVTFDPTSLSHKIADPDAAVSFRTPRLDLDSLYGSGPQDQPFLYESRRREDCGVKLLVGETRPWHRMRAIPDLPRNAQGRALIGDPRNDESVIIAQLHLLFIRFHNRVVDHLREQHVGGRMPGLAGAELFEAARKIVRWHYQWIVVNDLLPRFVDEDLLNGVVRARKTFKVDGTPFIPIEFSGAAYRFGHSMVRDSYNLGKTAGVLIFAKGDKLRELQHLAGFRQIPRGFAIDWSFFFESSTRTPQMSFRIDPFIAAPLWHLPAQVSDAVAADATHASLPRLNLMRANKLGVPSGQAVADKMNVPRLDEAKLGLAEVAPGPMRDELVAATPLWYYILCEAAGLPRGMSLGPVGGRIVAETLIGLLVSDPQSYLAKQPDWTPELPGTNGDFTMADLVNFTEKKKNG